jgi:hypothetical protein
VDESLTERELAERAGVTSDFDPGPAKLKNVSRPIRLFRASRVSGTAAPDQST